MFFSKKIIAFLILTVLSLTSYLNILQNGFAYDDNDFFIKWSSIKSFDNLPSLIAGELPQRHKGVFRPVRSIYYLLSYQLWKTNPVGYHLQALIIHLSITYLIYLIILALTQKGLLSLISAALFAVHPIHTEAISYTAASMDSLGILFFFLAIYLYIKFQQEIKPRKIFLVGSLLYTLLSYFTYEMTLTIPIIVVILDICFARFKSRFLSQFKIYGWYFLSWLFYLWLRFFYLHIGDRADYLGKVFIFAAKQARIEYGEILLKYIWASFAPINLSIIYELPTGFLNNMLIFLYGLDSSGRLINIMAAIDVIVPIILLFGAAMLVLWLFKKQPILKFSLVWFFLTLLPVASILPQGTVLAERFLYIPSFGFCLFLGWVFVTAGEKLTNFYLKAGLALVLIGLVSFYSITTIGRNRDWQNNQTIWLKAVQVTPSNALAYAGLGNVYLEQGDYELAIQELKKSAQIDPSDERVYYHLGRAYQLSNRHDLAERSYQTSIKINKNYLDPYNGLGDLYILEKRFDLAVLEYNKAINLSPKVADYYYNLANAQEQLNNIPQAIASYQKAVELDPNHALALNNLGVLYGKLGQYDLAIKILNLAKGVEPDNANVYFNLGMVYELKGQQDLAKQSYQTGLKLKPDEQRIRDKIS